MYENAIHYDMYSVYMIDNQGDRYLFDHYTDGQVIARRWDDNEEMFCIDAVLNPKELTLNSFSGIYYYHAHELRFNSLSDLSWFSEFSFRVKSDWENRRFSREKYLYRQRKQDITDVMSVLSAVVRIYREQVGENHFSKWQIMNDVAGKLWIYHDDKDRMQKIFNYVWTLSYKVATLLNSNTLISQREKLLRHFRTLTRNKYVTKLMQTVKERCFCYFAFCACSIG